MNDLVIIACLCGAGFVHGFTGFGYAMTAMAILPLVMPLPQVLFVGALFTLPVAGSLLMKYSGHFRWRDGWPLVVGATVGTPPGLLLAEHLDRLLLVRALGVVLIVFPLGELVRLPRLVRLPAWSGFPIGVGCGILGAAFNISGPVAILWIGARGWGREQATATLQVLFLFNSGLRVLATLPSGVMTPDLALLCALALVPFLAVAVVGNRLAERVDPARFRLIVLAALMAMGTRYVAGG